MQSIRIEGSCGISKEEVEKMKKDAEIHAEEDKKKQELIEVKNIAEQTLYLSEKTLKDLSDKINDNSKKEIEEKIEELKKDSVERIKIQYDPSVWEPGSRITFQVITEDGKYFGESSFTMNRENAIKTFIHYSLERVRTVFSKIYNIRK